MALSTYIAGGDHRFGMMLEFEMVLLPRFCTERRRSLMPQHGTERTETIPAHLAERVRREVKTYQAGSETVNGGFLDSNLPVVLDPTMLLCLM